MSADNFIAVKKNKGRWYVFMAFASDDRHGIPASAKSYKTKVEALLAADELYDNSAVVEYGVQVIK